MGTEHAPVSQAPVTKAPPVQHDDHAAPQHEGPTDAVFKNGWAPKEKKPPATAIKLHGKKAEGKQDTIQAVNASLDAIAGRLDAAAARIDALIKLPIGPQGPGVVVAEIANVIDHANHANEASIVARHKAGNRLGSESLRRITSSEARLDAAIKRALSYAKANGQQLETRPFLGIQGEVSALLGTQGLKREDLQLVQPQPSSTQDLRARAVTEHLEAALTRAQFIRIGMDAAKPDEIHTAIEEYVAHLNSADRAAVEILDERANDSRSHRPPARLSSTMKKNKNEALKLLVIEVGALVAEAKGNPKIKQQSKWSDVTSKLNAAKRNVSRL